MERLLDPSISDQEFLVLLEQAIQVLYTSTNQQDRNAVQSILTQLQSLPDSWIRVDKILDSPNSSSYSKFYGLQILNQLISYRWKILPRETCEQIRNYVVNKVIDLSSNEETLKKENVYITKLNLNLVQIVKQEWPHNWRSFITDLVGASKTSIPLCENNMHILALLSEEVFDFSSGQMTQAKITELRNQFNEEFSAVFQLCQYVFKETKDIQDTRPSLINATLNTLERFLSWIPLGYIFETELIDILVDFIMKAPLRTNALRCLVEIGSLSVGNMYEQKFQFLYISFMRYLTSVLPPTTDIAAAYDDSDDDTQSFVMDLSLFFAGFFQNHLMLLDRESGDLKEALRVGLEYLLRISMVNDIEIFKTCADWWHQFASDLYINELPVSQERPMGTLVLDMPGINHNNGSSRLAFYAPILSALRRVVISKMAKPEEILIVEDENGEIVRETTKDTDAIALYKTMRETLVFLTHLDSENTEQIMLEKLARQSDGSEWSWNNLNTLCWAIGSISGAMGEEEEKRFLVTVIKDLLHLCEMKRGKDNKAVVASNIMYVVGQYPRFLRAHWKFLKTVINKLFEFMHEMHPGVQDMACDTFLKISQKCRRKFTTVQPHETRPFIEEILENLPEIIAELEPHQIHSFYESCGCIIAACLDQEKRNELIATLFDLPNQSWRQLIFNAQQNEESIGQRDCMKSFVNILKTNTKVASSLGAPYFVQLKVIYTDLLRLYKVYSNMISMAVAANGPMATKTADCRNMRGVKKEALRVLEAFITNCEESRKDIVLQEIIEPMSQSILEDYYNSVAEARDAEVLSLFTQIINYTKGLSVPAIQLIFKSLFSCTLDMIKNNFEDFPDARINFFELLRAVNRYNFPALFQLDNVPSAAESEFRIVINAIIWAFKHTERNVAETGLQILLDMLGNVERSTYIGYFYKHYFKLILNDILSVLTDTLHRPGFSFQTQIIMQLVQAVNTDKIQEPIWDTKSAEDNNMASYGANQPSNVNFVTNHLMQLLKNAFPNLTQSQVQNVVQGMLTITNEKAFKNHMRDFLVQTKEFSGGDNADLYDEEKRLAESEKLRLEQERLARTPGLIAPVNLPTNEDGMT